MRHTKAVYSMFLPICSNSSFHKLCYRFLSKIFLLWLKIAVMMSALSRSSHANKLKQPATTTGAVIRCTGPCGLSNGTFSTRKIKKIKPIKTSYLINLAKILMKTRQISIGKLLHFLIALPQSSQQADGNMGIKNPNPSSPELTD